MENNEDDKMVKEYGDKGAEILELVKQKNKTIGIGKGKDDKGEER